MDRMKGLGLPALAAKYKDLSKKIMEHEVNRYVQIFQAMPPANATPMPMPMLMPMPMPTPTPTSSSLEFSDTNLATDVDSQDEEFFSAFGIDEPVDSLWEEDEDGYLHPNSQVANVFGSVREACL
jgi:hypothetical protein